MNGIFFDLRTLRAVDLGAIFGKIIGDGKVRGCTLSYFGANLTIAKGHMVAKGRLIAFDNAETIASETTAANGYGRLKLSIDLSQAASGTSFAQALFSWDYAATNSFPALTQNDINDGTNTAYQVEICRVSFYNSTISGIVSQLGDAEIKSAAVSRLTPSGGTVNLTLSDNTEYRFTSAVTSLTLTFPTGNFDCWLEFTTGSSISVNFPANATYLGGAPTFEASKTYEMSIKDGSVICAEVEGSLLA